MFAENNQISVQQMKRMITIEIFSTTSLLLPAILARQAEYDGLLPLLLGSVLGVFYARYFIRIVDATRQDYISYAKRSLGQAGAVCLAFLYFIRFVIRGGFALELFCRLVLNNLLPDHKLWTIAVPMLLLCGYISLKGIEVRGRTLEFLFYLIFVPLILVLVLALPKTDLMQVIPRMKLSIGGLAQGSYVVLLCYSAVEFLLFLTPQVKERKTVKKHVTLACIMVIVLNIAVFFVTVGMFGVQATKRSLWPALSIMQTVRIPGGFVERLDILLIAFWIFSMFGIISAYLYYASYFAVQTTTARLGGWFVLGFLILVYLLCAAFSDMETAFTWFSRYMAFVDFPIGFFAPLLLVMVGRIRRVS